MILKHPLPASEWNAQPNDVVYAPEYTRPKHISMNTRRTRAHTGREIYMDFGMAQVLLEK